MTIEQWEKIESGIWDVEIGLDGAFCLDGEEPEEVAERAGELHRTAIRLRQNIVELRKLAGKSRPERESHGASTGTV
jgi:hypothetical protein